MVCLYWRFTSIILITGSPFQTANNLVENNGHLYIKNIGQEVYATASWPGSPDGREDLHAQLPPERRPHPRRLQGDGRLCRDRQGEGDGARGHHRGGQEGQPPRPRRRRLPHRDQVVVHPQGLDGAEVPRGQRRRRRARDVQGPLPPRARSPRPDRGHADRRARHRLPQGLRVHPGRVRAAVADLQRGGPRGLRRGLLGKKRSARVRLRRGGPPRSRRVHLRRGDGAPLVARGQEGLAEDQAAVPGRQGRLRHPTIVNNVETLSAVPHIIDRGGEWFAGLGHEEPGRHAALFGLGPRGSSRAWSEAPVSITLRSLIYDEAGGIANGSAAQGRGPRRVLGGHPHRRRDRRLDGRGRAQERGNHGGLGGRDRHGRHHVDPRGAHGGGPLLRPRVVRAVHALPRVHRLDLQDRPPHRGGQRAQGRSRHHPGRVQARRGDDDLRLL